MTAAAREASAIAIVERMRREDAPHEVSSAITSKVGRARLRDVLRDGNTLVTFHKGAASALAELGDQKALTVLQAIAPEITDSAPETARGARPRGPVGVIVEPYMRRIEIQKSPEHMLAFIARYDGIRDLTGAQIRVWAIGRALRMGIPHDDVREAVSAHLAATSAELAPGQARSPLRAAALELGLISDDEFENLRGYMPRRRLH